MDKIRVLHLLTSLAPGGAETNLLALGQFFDTERFEHAVAFGGDGALKDEFATTKMRLIRMASKGISFSSYLRMNQLCRKMEQFSPDIIHSHLDLTNMVGLFVKWRLGCKLIMHLHGSGIIPRSHVPGRGSKHWLWGLLSKAYRHSDRIIAICSYQLPFLEKLNIDPARILLIPNGITLGNTNFTQQNKNEGYHFINVARFFTQKGHEFLIRAFDTVSRVNPQARLTLVGDGPLRKDVERQVNILGLQDKVVFTGIRRDVPELLRKHHCFVLSSLWELQPITILEAMRAGLPVIATNVGGVEDTLVHGKTGLLVQVGDDRSLSAAMLKLVSDPKLTKTMGETGAIVVKERFSNELVARQIESVYFSLAKVTK